MAEQAGKRVATGRTLAVAALAFCATACSLAPSTREMGQNALAAMGGAERVRAIRNFAMTGGTGSRAALGQAVKVTLADHAATLAEVVETVDLANGRAALAYEVTTPSGFSQRRREILTKVGDRPVGLEEVGQRPLTAVSASGLFSWGTQNSPAMTLRRNVVVVALSAAEAATTELTESRTLDERSLQYGRTILDHESVGVYFDSKTGLIAAYETLDSEEMLGDVTAVYLLDDYRPVAGVLLPHRIRILKGDAPYADVQFTGATVNNDAAMNLFEIPPAATVGVEQVMAAGADYSPVTLTSLGHDVYFAQAYSHHSLVVVFPSYIALVEAPYTEAQTRTLVRRLETQFPGKPVKYAAVTHPHFDHTGGLRAVAAAGATILVTDGHARAIRALLEARHTNPADALGINRSTGGKVGGLSVFNAKYVLGEGEQLLELYALTGSPHADPIVVAFVPSAGILFQSDLYVPATGAPSTPEAVHLLQALRKLGITPTVHAGGHGGVAPFDELVKAIGE